MWSQQIIVALLCTSLASQQVAAVVNNGHSSKTDDSKQSVSENVDASKSGLENEVDPVGAGSETNSNRREAPLSLGDAYGAPLAVAVDSYLPPGPSNVNLPVPVYGVPDAPTNNIVYPAPPPDIPPPVSLPSSTYGVPVITYEVPAPNNYIPPSAGSYTPPSVNFEGVALTPPKLFGPVRAPKPPRPQYGPPPKPFNSKFPSKYPYKSNFGVHKHAKPLTTYGPPLGYFKDNYSPSKFNVKFNNIFSDTNTFSQSNFASQSSHASIGGHLTQHSIPNAAYALPNNLYGAPNVGIQTHSSDLNILSGGGNGISNQYGAPDISIQILQESSVSGGHSGHSLSSQYGVPDGDVLGPPRPHYGPPQPSPHPRPPHPGAPAPPTPPDIKYDGWQPIPGLVSRVPADAYGAPSIGGHGIGDLGGNKDLVPPPVALGSHFEHASSTHGSAETYGGLQNSVSDSYGAPLNTVTGSGGIVSSSGEEVHGQHLSHSGTIDIDIGHSGSSGKGIGIDIYPSGIGSLGGQGHSSGGYNSQLGNSYGAPPLNSYSSTGPYPASHSNNIGSSSLGFGSLNFHGSQNSHNSYNSYKSHGYKALPLPNPGKGLIPPSGVYGATPSGHYGTPLFSNAGHGPPLNALKINPPRHPVVHREPVPSGLFDTITKQGSHKHIHGQSSQGHFGFSSTYLSPPVSDIPKPPLPSTLYSLPSAHSSISFQNIGFDTIGSSEGLLHQNLNLNVDAASGSGLSSYDAPLNIVDGSYNLPHSQSHVHSHLGGEVVGLDLSHPALTIDLTQNGHGKGGFSLQDCNVHKVPSLSYGVPSVNSYTASLSSLTTNIGGAQALPQTSYGLSEAKSVPSVDISYQVSEPHSESHHNYDLSAAHSEKVSSQAKANLIETETHGKSYGKSVAASFGPSSELIQSQSLDLNNISLQGARGSYTLQIQSADGSQGEVAHGQVLNEGLLQSILAAIEQPEKNSGRPIIQLQKSLEKQNFVTNDSIPEVVGKLADEQIEENSAPVQYVVEPSKEVLTVDKVGEDQKEETRFPLVEDNGIALYFNSNSQRSKKETEESSVADKISKGDGVEDSH